MRGRSLRVGTWLLASVLSGCAPAPSPSPPVTPPPIPADFVPWHDIVWKLADLHPRPLDVSNEHVAAVTATDAAIVAVGYREIDEVRDGIVWRSTDGTVWDVIDDAVFDRVELVDIAPAPGGFVALGVEPGGAATDHPTVVVFRSPDGASWLRLPPLAATGDAFPGSVAGGADGVLAVGSDASGAPAVWRAPDGRSFRRVDLGGPAVDGLIDPHVTGDGFVALGPSTLPPTMLRSSDGTSWSASSIDARPDTQATKLVVGRWGMVVQGVVPPQCGGQSAPCPDDYIAWWSHDGRAWEQIPAVDAPSVNGVSLLVPAGVHGLLAIDGADAWSSPDGWAWRSLPEPGDGSVSIDDAVVRGDLIVAVGEEVGDDGSSVGRILTAH
jgi:hypothetical protein